MEGLSNIYIDNFLRSCHLRNYLGTFSSNNIPSLFHSQNEASVIVNLSPVGTLGTHFISLMKQNEQYFLADSLGLTWNDLPSTIQMYVPSNVVIMYPIPLQSLLSSFCGFYAILFILNFNTYNSTPGLIPFSTQRNNDSICLHNIHKIRKYIFDIIYICITLVYHSTN